MDYKYDLGDNVEWIRYGGLFGICGFRCTGTIVGFGEIGGYPWYTIICHQDNEIYRVEASRVSIIKPN